MICGSELYPCNCMAEEHFVNVTWELLKRMEWTCRGSLVFGLCYRLFVLKWKTIPHSWTCSEQVFFVQRISPWRRRCGSNSDCWEQCRSGAILCLSSGLSGWRRLWCKIGLACCVGFTGHDWLILSFGMKASIVAGPNISKICEGGSYDEVFNAAIHIVWVWKKEKGVYFTYFRILWFWPKATWRFICDIRPLSHLVWYIFVGWIGVKEAIILKLGL